MRILMKNILTAIIILLLSSLCLDAQSLYDVKAENARLTRNGDYFAVLMDLDLSELKVRNERAVVLTPTLKNGDKTITLNSIGVYSYNRWHYYRRNGETMITGADETSYKEADLPDTYAYEMVVPYEDWMDGAQLCLFRNEYGCCSKLLNSQGLLLASYDGPFIPEFLYITPDVETVKTRYLSGTAYIDFPVSKSVIIPDFRNNVEEIGKIRASIDSVRNDRDVTIKSMTIKGFASPESSYANNASLAESRTEALKQYVNDLYNFPNGLITTSFEPEDWAGLREYVAASSLPHKREILELIDSDRDPDNKEWKIKSTYKEDYRHLLDHCYPALRRSDYRIEYVVRAYTDPEEIAQLIRTKPQSLSLNELYVYAKTLEPGSYEFIEVFETAVRMYPDDEKANLNAANTAMGRGDLKSAGRYLDKAGNSPEATYARACYAYLSEQHDTALSLARQALLEGVTQAQTLIERLEKTNR